MAAPLSELLDRAAAVLADLRQVDLDGLDGGTLSDAVLAMQRLRGRLESAEARVLSRWDAEGCWRASGARTGAAWLAWRQRVPIQVARQRLRHARSLRTLPALEEAWTTGEIDRSHLTTMLGARTSRTTEAFDADHGRLLDLARHHGFADFKRACDRWELMADPDGAEQGADDDRQAREVHLSQSFGGMWFGRTTLDPVSGQIVDTTLRLIDKELFDADWAESKARLGREPTVLDLWRTPAQRRADALVEMATRARTAPAGGRRPAPLFTVVVGLETLQGPILELFNRTVLTPATAAAHLAEAYVERVVFDSPSRVLDVGVPRRFFTGGLRRAIEIRDRTCFHPSCDDVPDRPEIDHIHEASKGGPTTQWNGRYGCRFHNLWTYRNAEPSDDPDDDPDPPRG
jgi:hypothetical protein